MSIQQGLLLILCLLGMAVGSDNDEYQNEIGCDLHVECPNGFAMYAVEAKVGLVDETVPEGGIDYQWYWDCAKIGSWSDYKWESDLEEHCWTQEDVNSYKELLAFRCPKDSYISGLWSAVVDPWSGERVWSVQCCRQPGMCITDCSLSDYISDFEEDIDYSALEGEYFVGLFSHVDLPDEAYKGRKWKIGQCRFEECSLEHYLEHYGLEDYFG